MEWSSWWSAFCFSPVCWPDRHTTKMRAKLTCALCKSENLSSCGAATHSTHKMGPNCERVVTMASKEGAGLGWGSNRGSAHRLKTHIQSSAEDPPCNFWYETLKQQGWQLDHRCIRVNNVSDINSSNCQSFKLQATLNQVLPLLLTGSVFGLKDSSEGLSLLALSGASNSQSSSFHNFCRPLEDYGPRLSCLLYSNDIWILLEKRWFWILL